MPPSCMFPRQFNSSFSFQFLNNYPLCNVITLLNLQQVLSFQFIMLVNKFVKQVDAHDLDFLLIEQKAITSFIISTTTKLCRNPNLGLVTKARACKIVGQEGSLGVMPHALGSVGKCEGMNPHTSKGASTWELKSQWIPKSLESDCTV